MVRERLCAARIRDTFTRRVELHSHIGRADGEQLIILLFRFYVNELQMTIVELLREEIFDPT